MLSPDSFLLLLYHMQGPEGAPFGRTFGVRVDGPLARGLWPPVGGGLCRRVVEKGCGKGFLRWTGPMGRRVLKFDGAFGPEGCGIALSGDEHEVSVTDSTFCVIWHNKHYDDQPPPVAFPPLVPYGTTFPPLSGGTIKIRKAILS